MCVWCVCGVVWCGVDVVWCGVVWCGVGVVWCGVVWCGVSGRRGEEGVVWCGVVWCGGGGGEEEGGWRVYLRHASGAAQRGGRTPGSQNPGVPATLGLNVQGDKTPNIAVTTCGISSDVSSSR